MSSGVLAPTIHAVQGPQNGIIFREWSGSELSSFSCAGRGERGPWR